MEKKSLTMPAFEKEICFMDLAAQQQRILPAINDRIKKVLAHGQYIMGPEVFELEKAFETYLGVEHAVACASGTDALLMALMALDIGPGDAVFTSPFTFVATAEVISLLGATPVFVDVEPDTFNLDPTCLEQAIIALTQGGSYPIPETGTQQLVPRCIIPVDLFGLPADYSRINQIADQHNLVVVADAAQSFGATIGDKKACACAHVAATSFFPSKPLGCYGDGGAVFTNDDALAEQLRSIRAHGKGSQKYDNIRIGINGRLDTIQAAVLLEKMTIFDSEVRLRRDIAALYNEKIAPDVRCQFIPAGFNSAWAQFSLLSNDRTALLQRLRAYHIPTAIYYPKTLHCQKAFSYLNYKQDDFPVAARLSQTIFSLPMHPYLDRSEVTYICDVINGAEPQC